MPHHHVGAEPSQLTFLAAALTVTMATAAAPVAALPPSAAHVPTWQTVVVSGAGDAAAAVRSVGGQVLKRLPLLAGVTARIPTGAALGSFSVVPNRAINLAGTSTSVGPATTVRATLGLGAPRVRAQGPPSPWSTRVSPTWPTSPGA